MDDKKKLISLVVTDKIHRQLQELAGKAGMSEYIRRLVVKEYTKSQINSGFMKPVK